MPNLTNATSGTHSLSRRLFLRSSLAAGSTVAAQTAREKPNIIFILADDLGWGDLGCYGHPDIKTPNLDRLAKEGTRFTQYYVNAPVCSPSRAGLLTGQFPARQGIHYWMAPGHNKAHGMPQWLDPAVHTTARLLKDAGYTTAHFGKWHLGEGAGAPDPTAYGYDECRVICQGNGPRIGSDCADPRGTELLVDESIRFMQRRQPFFINLWTRDVHAALRPTAESLARYEKFKSQKQYQTSLQVYYAAVTEMDLQLGRLFDKLDEMGIAGRTLVLFSSDNGPEDPTIAHAAHHAAGTAGPFRGRKWSLYEGGVRMPFIARWTGQVPANRVDNTTVISAVDMLPTYCALAGVPQSAGFRPDGQDMTAALLGTPSTARKPLFWEWRFEGVGEYHNRSPILAVRQGNWKLLMNPDGSRIELYDITRQPMELHSVAREHPDIVKRLSRPLLEWQKELPKGPMHPAAGSDSYPWPKPL